MRFAVEAWAPEYGSPNEAGAMAETEVPGDEARCGIDLVLAIESIKQSSTNFLG